MPGSVARVVLEFEAGDPLGTEILRRLQEWLGSQMVAIGGSAARASSAAGGWSGLVSRLPAGGRAVLRAVAERAAAGAWAVPLPEVRAAAGREGCALGGMLSAVGRAVRERNPRLGLRSVLRWDGQQGVYHLVDPSFCEYLAAWAGAGFPDSF